MTLAASLSGLNGIITNPGLAGKFFDGDFSVLAASGSVGTLPLTSTNNNPGMSGVSGLPSASYLHGVNVWPSINWGGPLGLTYGFIAIGFFVPPTTGTYNFYTTSDDNSGVWLGEIANAPSGRRSLNAVVNNDLDVPSGQSSFKRGGTIDLRGGQVYPIRIVYQQGTGSDNMQFSWSGPSITETTDLTQYFYNYGTATNPTGNF